LLGNHGALHHRPRDKGFALPLLHIGMHVVGKYFKVSLSTLVVG